jgi:hypothetical protein
MFFLIGFALQDVPMNQTNNVGKNPIEYKSYYIISMNQMSTGERGYHLALFFEQDHLALGTCRYDRKFYTVWPGIWEP